MKLSIQHINRYEDAGGALVEWIAVLNENNNSPVFDGCGSSIEGALCDLIENVGQYIEKSRLTKGE